MSYKNSFFQWKSSPTKQYDFESLNLDPKTCISYTSFILNNESYKLGDYVYVKASNETVIGRLLCAYETREVKNCFYGVLRIYRFGDDLCIKSDKKFIENEVIEDDVKKDVMLLEIKGKCNVILATEDDFFDDIIPGTYILRYKLLNHKLISIFSSEAIKHTNVLNQFNKVLTPNCSVTSKYKEIPYVCDTMKRVRISEAFLTPKKLNVCRNLNESFDGASSQEGTPTLNYSLVEDNFDTNLKIKLRLSKNQPIVALDKLNDSEINKYITKTNEVETSVRRSTRSKQRVSYVEMINTPPRRGRKKSTDDVISITDEEINLTPSKRKVNYEEKDVSPKKISRLSRTTRSSIQDTQDIVYTTKSNYQNPLKITLSARKTRNSTKENPIIDEKHEEVTPSKRKTATPVKYNDYISSPLLKKSILKQSLTNSVATPKKSVYYDDESDSSIDSLDEAPKKKKQNIASLKTPNKTPNKNMATTPKSVQKTPGSRAKLIRDGMITPSVQSRATPIKIDKTPLNMAKTKLHVSYVPEVLVGREKEFNDVYNFVEGKLLDGCGGCMYISGVPGTGKTATVTEVIKKLHSQVQLRCVPGFEFVSINGMKLSEPRQSYVEILRQLTGKSVRWEQAQSILDTKFTKNGNKNKPIVLLVDELDILCTKRQDVVYNLLDWPTKSKAQLIVITIANTMDLPERLLMGRVTSRLGLTRLTFQAYTHKQLQEIVTRRLLGTNTFNPDAIQLVARKVASISGDARRALDICRRSAEFAELEGNNTLVSMIHVDKALNAMITQPKVQAIKCCSRIQQLILQAVVAEVERTGVEETTFCDIYTMLISIAALDGFQMVAQTVVLRSISRLGACRLLLTDQKSNDYDQKIILNVSSDDVYYALRKD
ncbi:origin recognition complex subunit 1 [Onthophagus taurus]|uniref:origin recognition complex subunit 1 n=1 Tax=Onthophagus taurus TaxID=166361 RepID=UPI0039BECDB0